MGGGTQDAERFVRHPDAVGEPSGDELLLVHLALGSTYRLNRTGRRVWELLIGGAPLSDVAERLAAELGTTRERLLEDARALVRDLLEARLLVRATAERAR